MKLITELNEEMEVISEGSGESKKLYITGPFLQSEVLNRNGRIYRKPIMENAVNLYKPKIENRQAYGELNHPATPQIDLERVSHRIVSLTEDGNNWIGKALIMDTPTGKIAKGLYEGGCNLGVSSRGIGTITKTPKGNMVNEDFRFATAADIVSDPSAPEAFVNGIMEGVEWVWNDANGPQALEIADHLKKVVHRKPLNEQQMLKAFNVFLENVGRYNPS